MPCMALPSAEFSAVSELSSGVLGERLAQGSPVLMEPYRPQYINNINAKLPHLRYVSCAVELPS